MNSAQTYMLMWRGSETGPLTLQAIQQRLRNGELHSMYEISVEGAWIPLRDFLETISTDTSRSSSGVQRVAATTQPERLTPALPVQPPQAQQQSPAPWNQSPPPPPKQLPPPLPPRRASASGETRFYKLGPLGTGTAVIALILVAVAGTAWFMTPTRVAEKSPTEPSAESPTESDENTDPKTAETSDMDTDMLECTEAYKLWIGEGVVKDSDKAVSTFLKLAERGNPVGQMLLGFAFAMGQGIPKDDVAAVEWFTKSAMQGNNLSQFTLGVAYGSGSGVSLDIVKSHTWFQLAKVSGNNYAQAALTKLEESMSRAQIAEAEIMVSEIQSKLAGKHGNQATPEMIFNSNPLGNGTGFFITRDGYLVTNFHVVEKATNLKVKTDYNIKNAKVVRVDKENDLALLKVEGAFAAIPIGSSKNIVLGNSVATVGFPNIALMGFSPKLAKGDIASLGGIQDDQRYFQISVPVQPGNSGGALVSATSGNVVGIVSAKLNAKAALDSSGALPENVNYAVKSALLMKLIQAVPGLPGKLEKEFTGDRKFEDVVKGLEKASALVLVY